MHVTVETGMPPVLLAVRDETNAGWRGVATAGTSTFDLVVSGPYQVVVVCPPVFDGAGVMVHARSPSDPPLLEHTCYKPFSPEVAVSGTMVTPGQIDLGYAEESSTTSNWSFEVFLEVGSYDLVLLQQDSVDPPRIALRRDVKVTENIDLGALDVAQEPGQALVETSFAVPSLQPGEQLSSGLQLRTGTTTARLPAFLGPNASPSWSMSLVPDAALGASDRQIASLAASTVSPRGDVIYQSIRSVEHDVHVGDTVPWSLPEPLGPVMFEMAAHRITVAWSSLGNYTDVSLRFLGTFLGPYQGRGYELMMTRRYIEDAGMAGATLDVTGIPGIPNEWQIGPSRWLVRELDVIRDVPGEARTVRTVSEEPASPPARMLDPASRRLARWPTAGGGASGTPRSSFAPRGRWG